MQQNRIDVQVAGARFGGAVPNPSRVQGLGLCDVLRVELEPCQFAGAIEELEEQRGPLNETFEHARTRWDALAEEAAAGSIAQSLEQELSKSASALRVLTMLRAQLPALDHDKPVVVVGPASAISELIALAARNAVDDLGELVRQPLRSGAEAEAKLRAALAAVVAWLDTYIECEALEWFTFDPLDDSSDPTT
jgi:hypothetical protein